MKVSIITPVYNGMRYFPETLKSVDRQTYQNFEHIIVDDRSTDGTFESLADSNPRRFWFRNDINMGESFSVNRAYELAKGELVLVLNADDLISPILLEIAVQKFREKPSLDVVYPDWDMIDEAGIIIQRIHTLNFREQVLFEDFNCIPGPGAVFRNNLLSPLRDSSFRWAGDYDQWMRLADVDNFERIPNVLASWRKHPEAQTHQRGLEMASERIRLIETAFHRENARSYSRRRALGAAYYFAARLVFFDSRVPSTVWLLKSYIFRPINWRSVNFRRPITISFLLAFPFLVPLLKRVFLANPKYGKLLSKVLGLEFSRRLSDALGKLE